MTTRCRETRRRWQQYRRAFVFSPLLLTAVMAGCVKANVRDLQKPSASAETPVTTGARYPALAGTWEYEESGNTIQIILNEDGSGPYQWKDGEFITTAYANGVWEGRWSQRENDRDGGFEVRLSPDGSGGEGRWWYTRIGSDTAPTQTGGVFQIARRSTSTFLNSGASGSSVRRNSNRQAHSRDNQ